MEQEPTKFKLKDADRELLCSFIRTGRHSSLEIQHAYILTALDKGKAVDAIMDYYCVGRATIWRTKKRYMKQGLWLSLSRKEGRIKAKKYETQDEDVLINLIKSGPPFEKGKWTIKLLMEEYEKTSDSKKISRETIRLILKRRRTKVGYGF